MTNVISLKLTRNDEDIASWLNTKTETPSELVRRALRMLISHESKPGGGLPTQKSPEPTRPSGDGLLVSSALTDVLSALNTTISKLNKNLEVAPSYWQPSVNQQAEPEQDQEAIVAERANQVLDDILAGFDTWGGN